MSSYRKNEQDVKELSEREQKLKAEGYKFLSPGLIAQAKAEGKRLKIDGYIAGYMNFQNIIDRVEKPLEEHIRGIYRPCVDYEDEGIGLYPPRRKVFCWDILAFRYTWAKIVR